MVLELLITDFQLKNAKIAYLHFIVKLMQNTVNDIVHMQTIEIQKKQLSQLSWQIDIPAFCSHYNTTVCCQFKDLKQNVLQTTTGIIQNNQLQVISAHAQFTVQIKNIESNKRYNCIQVKILEQILPNIILPLSKQSLSLSMKYRLYNGIIYSLSNKHINQFAIYKQQDNVVYLEGYIQIGDIELVLIQLQVTPDSLQKLIFKMSYLSPLQLAIIDLLLNGNNSNTSMNNVNKYVKLATNSQTNLSISNQEIIQKLFAKQVQSSFSNIKNTKKNTKNKGQDLDSQIQKELNTLGTDISFYEKLYQTYDSEYWNIKIYGNIQKGVLDTINFKISQQIEKAFIQSQNIFGFIKIYDAGNNFDIVVCQLNKSSIDDKSIYPSLFYTDIEQNAQYIVNKQNFEQQVLIQQKVSMKSSLDESYLAIIPTTYENQDFILGNLLTPIKLQNNNISNHSLFFYFYKNNQVINTYKVALSQLQKEFQPETLIQIQHYTGIQFKYCLTDLNLVQGVSMPQEVKQQNVPPPNPTAMMSTDVEAFEHARRAYLMQQGLPLGSENVRGGSARELQSLQEHLNDISAIEQQKSAQQQNNIQLRQNQENLPFNPMKTLDNHAVDTSILDMNDMKQLLREQNRFNIQNDIQKLENQLNYIGDTSASSNQELKQIIEKFEQISIKQQELLRYQENQMSLYDKNDEIDASVQNPDLSFEERQFIEMFLKKPGLFNNNDYVQRISKSFQKYEIAENIVKSILTRYYVQQAGDLKLSDEAQQNEETIQALEKRIQEEMEKDYMKDGNQNESYKNKKLGESFVNEKEKQYQLMNRK